MTLTSPRSIFFLLLSACGLNTNGFSDGPAGATSDTLTTQEMSTGDSVPASATLQLSFSQVKQFDFSWSAAAGAQSYQLLERPAEGATYEPITAELLGASISLTMPLHLRFDASYILRACNDAGCTDSEPVQVADSIAAAIGYFKASDTESGDWFGFDVAVSADGDTLAVSALLNGKTGAVYVFGRSNGSWTQQAHLRGSNTEVGDNFGSSVALSADGNTLAVGANGERSAATGVNGDMMDNSTKSAGAVYVFGRSNGSWSQNTYFKASNTGENDGFGSSIAISADGDTLAVGAGGEASAETGTTGTGNSDTAPFSGAVYVFGRSNQIWSQRAYLKASNTGAGDGFGISVSLSASGDILAVGAQSEDSATVEINGDQGDNSVESAGAVYVFVRSNNSWSQESYIKAANAGAGDRFGYDVAVSADGDTLVVGAYNEASASTGVGANPADNSAKDAGAAYVFVRSNNKWSQQAYLKAENTDAGDNFGCSVAVSADGSALAVGAFVEASAVTGFNGDQNNNSAGSAGAVYVFTRSSSAWSQRAYLKPANTDAGDYFGRTVAMSAEGSTLAVGAWLEGGAATGIGGNQANNSAPTAGAAYLF